MVLDIPLVANSMAPMEGLHAAISKQQAAHPGGAFIVAGDTNLRSVLLIFHQHVSCATREHNTLDHVYTNRCTGPFLSPSWVSLITSFYAFGLFVFPPDSLEILCQLLLYIFSRRLVQHRSFFD